MKLSVEPNQVSQKIEPAGKSLVAWDLWARLIALFLALCACKAIVMASLGEHLFQTHWRFSYHPTGWAEYACFLFFAVSVGASLGVLSRRARDWPVWDIRGINVAFIIWAVLFALLSREQVGRNYLYPIQEGVLSAREVWSYVELDLIYASPWVAVYLVGYAIIYALLRVRRKEHLSFLILGGVAAMYLLLNLHDLVRFWRSLAVVNTLAVAGWISLWRTRKPLRWSWQMVPLILILFVWWYCARHPEMPVQLDPYFVIVSALAVGLLSLANLLLRRSEAYTVMSHFLPCYVAAVVLFLNRAYPAADMYRNILVNALTLPGYFTQELLLTAALALVAFWSRQRWKRATNALFDIVAALLVLVAIIDLHSTRVMNVRLDWSLVTMGNQAGKLFETVRPFLPSVLMALLIFVLGRHLLQRWMHRHSNDPSLVGPAAAAPPVFVIAWLVLSMAASLWITRPDKVRHMGLVQFVLSTPLLRGAEIRRLPAEQFFVEARRMGIADYQMQPPPVRKPMRDLNVVVVMMESSHNRFLSLFGSSDETQPMLARYRDRMELFPNYFSPFPNSFHARFTAFNGLYPSAEYVSHLNPRISCPSLFEILHQRGYHNSLFYSSSRNYTRFNDYIGHRSLDLFFDSDNMPHREEFPLVSWGVSEEATLRAMKDQVAMYARHGERFCMTYIPAAPHMPFDPPSHQFRRFTEGASAINNDFSGRYKNSLLYMDWVISSLIESLEQNGLLDRTLVIITNDHGEMVGDQGGILGHGWSLAPGLCNTPLVIMDPARRGNRINYTIGSHVDFLPTVLDSLNIPLPGGELYQGTSLFRDNQGRPSNRRIYLHSYQDRAVILGHHFVLYENESHRPANVPPRPRTFKITNDGVRTEFLPVDQEKLPVSPESLIADHRRFTKLQDALIINYDYYREARPSPRPLPLGASYTLLAPPLRLSQPTTE